MFRDKRQFTAFIIDPVLGERFSAMVTVTKMRPLRKSLQPGRIDLADVFITPISDQLPAKVHHHFVVHDFTGRGIYIIRDRLGKEEHKRPTSVWELGQSFGAQVLTALKSLA